MGEADVEFSQTERFEWGAGATSLVFKERQADGSFYSLKKLLPKFQGRPEFEALVESEFFMLNRIRHPLVSSVVSIREEEGVGGVRTKVLVQSWIEGWTLQEIFSWAENLEASFRRKWGWNLLSQFRLVISHLETQGVVHGDLCPENVLVTKEGFIRLIDFGSSKAANANTINHLDLGHPPFTATLHRYGLGSDRFSVGKILEYWWGSSAGTIENRAVSSLIERRAWPEPTDASEEAGFEALPLFPFLGLQDGRDRRIPKTAMQKASWIEWNFAKFAQTPFALLLMFILLVSGSPRASLDAVTFPLSEITISQGSNSIKLSMPVRSIPLKTGRVQIEIHDPLVPERSFVKQFVVQSGQEYKIFEDFQNLDTLKSWTENSTKM